MKKYEKCAGWYCIVTKENRDVLSEWGFGKNSHELNISNYVGMSKHYSEKGHNAHTGYNKNDGKCFDKCVSIEKLFEATNFKYKKESYEIY